MAASDDGDPAQSPRLDSEVCRRDVLRAAGAAGATAAIASTPGLAQTNNSTEPESEYMNAVGTFGYGMGSLAYFSGKAIDGIASLAPWGDESSFKEKYEYQQRLEIYRRAYDFEQMEQRALTGVENQANLYSRVAMEDGLLELFNQAEQGASRTDATAAAKEVVTQEWAKIQKQMLTHLEQNQISIKNWHNHLVDLPTDLEDTSASISYTMKGKDPFTGDLEETTWAFRTYPYQTLDGKTIDIQGAGPQSTSVNDYSQVFWMSVLPYDLSDPDGTNADQTNRSWENDDNNGDPYWEQYASHMDGFDFEDDYGTLSSFPDLFLTSGSAGNGQLTLSTLAVDPPNPVDFEVDPEQVEDVSDHPETYVSALPRYYSVLELIATEHQNSLDGVETWANSNYVEMRDNPDQWDRDDMVGPAALQESAANATNPAEAALQLRGMGISVNNENDVLLEFPEQEGPNGNAVQAPGYLGATSSPEGGFPVGEVIDPEDREGGIYFAHWASDIATEDSPDSGGNTTDGNTTDDNTSDGGLDGDLDDDSGTYSELVQPFKIVKTADGSDALAMNARDVSTPDYDWEQVVENLEDLNTAQDDAQDQTIEVINEGGGGGPLIPDDIGLGMDSPLAGLAIIGGAVVAVGAAVMSLLPGN